ncbi:MAG: PilN domain-containing protein [Deltaproteobacteria bacterium]|nr:PilN domain-containing protein [Deltaproteobacteria bacterium]
MKKKNRNKTRINLLPAADKERFIKNRKKAIIFSIIIAYGFFIFLLDFTTYLENSSKRIYISGLNQKLMLMKTKNILNKSLESAINSRKNLENTIKKRILIIKNLEKFKVAWNKKIGDVVQASPSGVWMSELLLQKGVITIDGNSISLNGISIYIDRLKTTNMFKKIILTDAGREIIGGNTFYHFQLKATLTPVIK